MLVSHFFRRTIQIGELEMIDVDCRQYISSTASIPAMPAYPHYRTPHSKFLHPSDLDSRKARMDGTLTLKKAGRLEAPFDGVVTEGRSSIEEPMSSGEPVPVEKIEGDMVMGATGLSVKQPCTQLA